MQRGRRVLHCWLGNPAAGRFDVHIILAKSDTREPSSAMVLLQDIPACMHVEDVWQLLQRCTTGLSLNSPNGVARARSGDALALTSSLYRSGGGISVLNTASNDSDVGNKTPPVGHISMAQILLPLRADNVHSLPSSSAAGNMGAYNLLLVCTTRSYAAACVRWLDGAPYNSVEPDRCQALLVDDAVIVCMHGKVRLRQVGFPLSVSGALVRAKPSTDCGDCKQTLPSPTRSDTSDSESPTPSQAGGGVVADSDQETDDNPPVHAPRLRRLPSDGPQSCAICLEELAFVLSNGTRNSHTTQEGNGANAGVLGSQYDEERGRDGVVTEINSPSDTNNVRDSSGTIVRTSSSVRGIAIALLCGHEFHMSCLGQLEDFRCPVCRCGFFPQIEARCAWPGCRIAIVRPLLPTSFSGQQSYEPQDHTLLGACGADDPAAPPATTPTPTTTTTPTDLRDSTHDEPSSQLLQPPALMAAMRKSRALRLWMCLLCGHVGCGRFAGGHAKLHFERSNHVYSMDVATGEVWDYKEDEFVHRLAFRQSKTALSPPPEAHRGHDQSRTHTRTNRHSSTNSSPTLERKRSADHATASDNATRSTAAAATSPSIDTDATPVSSFQSVSTFQSTGQLVPVAYRRTSPHLNTPPSSSRRTFTIQDFTPAHAGDGALSRVIGPRTQAVHGTGWQSDTDEQVTLKLESILREYTGMLTSQLDQQRRVFKQQISAIDAAAYSQHTQMEGRLQQAERLKKSILAQQAALQKEMDRVDAKLISLRQHCTQKSERVASLRSRHSALAAVSARERTHREKTGKQLLSMQRAVIKAQDLRIKQLREQVDDLEYHLRQKRKLRKINHRIDGTDIKNGKLFQV